MAGSLTPQTITTGLTGLDDILDGLRTGDNVVWRVQQIEDYRRFVIPFVEAALAEDRDIIYLRFGQHAPLINEQAGVTVVTVDALGGFEPFTARVWQLIEDYGRGAFYVCDCLSDLLEAWVTDTMVGNFFRVVCPFLFELDTVAWFALYPHSHSHQTLNRIRETTQVLVDLHRTDDDVLYLQPVKVWQRHSPTMFLLHRQQGGDFRPITDSSEATRLQADLEQRRNLIREEQLLDYWDRLFLRVSEQSRAESDPDESQALLKQVLSVLMGRDERMLSLAGQYFRLQDVLAIRDRLIGTGFIGGKAAGMLLARRILEQRDPECWQQALEPHDSWYLGSDLFYAFLVHNGCWPGLMRQRTEAGYFEEAEPLRQRILQGGMPPEVRVELERMLDYYGQYPILVRSSSLLEDGFGNAFAGKYESIFLINQGDPESRLEALEEAIRTIYASTLSEDALVYRQQRGLAGQEEPMALLVQRVNGRYHQRYYLPDAAGVGVSRNAFVWDEGMDPEAGMARLVLGMGTRAVDRIEGDHAAVIALDQPHRSPYRSRDERYRFTQHMVDLLDLEGQGLQSVALRDLAPCIPPELLRYMTEEDREASRRARDMGLASPVLRLTFDPLLRETGFVDLLRRMLDTLENAYDHPVDVEFTLHMNEQGVPTMNLVQCRPLATTGRNRPVALPEHIEPERLWFSTRGHFMGGNVDMGLDWVIRVSPEHYAQLDQTGRYRVARLIGQINRSLAHKQGQILLMGPGRWGTSSPELGVPVRFADISQVSVLVEEAAMGGRMVPDLSYGSHFFQDLVETGIVYVALFPEQRDTHYRPEWLEALPAVSLGELGMTDEGKCAAREAIRVHDVSRTGLRLMADLVAQRLACFAER